MDVTVADREQSISKRPYSLSSFHHLCESLTFISAVNVR